MGGRDGLQRLVEIEHQLSSRLLMKHYDGPSGASWDRCREFVIDYVLHTDSVREGEKLFS